MLSSGYALLIQRGAQAGYMLELPARHLELGRGIPPQMGADRVEIGEPSISRIQAWLFWYPEHEAFLIKHAPEATNPTYANGQAIDEYVLQPGDLINMGAMQMKFVLADQMQAVKATGFGPAVPSTVELDSYTPGTGAVKTSGASAPRTRFGLRVTKGHLADEGRRLSIPDEVLSGDRQVTLGGPDGRNNDLPLADPTVSPDQCRFEGQGGKLFIVPESLTPAILVRGMPLSGPCPLAGGEVIAIGSTVMQVESADGGASGRADGYLEYLQAPGLSLPAPIPLTRQATTIGRVGMCDIIIEDPAVSRLHVNIVRREGGHVLKHQSATNQTLVNGYAVRNEKRLENGDEIRICPSVLFRYVAGEGS